MKTDVFERLSRQYYEMLKQARHMRQLGCQGSANAMLERRYGIEEAVVALGFDIDEFISYYKANRARYRKEIAEHGTLM